MCPEYICTALVFNQLGEGPGQLKELGRQRVPRIVGDKAVGDRVDLRAHYAKSIRIFGFSRIAQHIVIIPLYRVTLF